MKTSSILIFFLFSLSIPLTAQKTFWQNLKKGIPLQTDEKIKTNKQKSIGDTLYYEDFSDTTLAKWTSLDSTNGNFHWLWSDQPPGGQYSLSIGTLNSSSAHNGYLLFPADRYNTPFPTTGPHSFNSMVTSSAIPLKPTKYVQLEFDEWHHYCCGGPAGSGLSVQISTDSINWSTPYQINFRPQSTTSANSYHERLNVSSDLSMEDTAYIRFNFKNASHYFWMIDDLTLVEGNPHLLVVQDILPVFRDTFWVNPVYTQIPALMNDSISYRLQYRNAGLADQHNVQGRIKLEQIKNCQGFGGSGEFYRDSATVADTLPTTRYLNRAVWYDAGQKFDKYYLKKYGQIRTSATMWSDSASSMTSNASTFDFVFTDTIYAKDREQFFGSASTSNYVGGGNVDDAIATVYNAFGDTNYNVNNPTPLASSLSFYITTDSTNRNAIVTPRIWEVTDTGLKVVGSSPFADTIRSSHLGSWKSISFFPPLFLNKGSSYAVGLIQNNLVNGKTIKLGRDTAMEKYAPIGSNLMYLNGNNPRWYSVDQQAAIRLNLGNFGYGGCGLVSVDENKETHLKADWKIYPNPTTGKVFMEEMEEEIFAVRVFDLQGKMLRQKMMTENNQGMDLTALPNGIYLIQIRTADRTLSQKLIIQK
jgi:hypothetical protein